MVTSDNLVVLSIHLSIMLSITASWGTWGKEALKEAFGLARAVNVEGDQLRFAIQRGLRPQLIGHVIESQPTSVDDVVNEVDRIHRH